ncbi:MAG: hypothetical protein RR910_02925 [Acidaminococcaceae bacterium]
MKKVLIMLSFFMFFCQTSFAMLMVNDQMLGAAQEYGKSKMALPTEELQKPWTVVESKKTNIYAGKEKLIIYTPFVIAAMDAQNKAKAYEILDLDASRALASNYEQILVIGAIIDAPEKTGPEAMRIQIKQGKNVTLPYHSELVAATATTKVVAKPVIPSQGKTLTTTVPTPTTELGKLEQKIKAKIKDSLDLKEPPVKTEVEPALVNLKATVWNLQYYLYFDLRQLDPDLPIVLQINDKLAGEREFKFHLGNMD